MNHNLPKRGIDLLGKTFGRLTVIQCMGTRGGQILWLCRCVCGGEKVVVSQPLRTGLTKSCGCLARDHGRLQGKRNATHGKSGTTEYTSWLAIRARCYKEDHQDYHRYGGRGITVCDRWRGSFSAFLADMGKKPSAQHSIDRIDNDGSYEPGNCRWSTSKEQNNNRRDNRILEHNGKSQTLAQWADEKSMDPHAILKRLQHGWSVAEALEVPPNGQGRIGFATLEWNGQQKTIREWCELLGLTKAMLHGRLRRGWSVERALTTPACFTRPCKNE